MKRSKPGQGAPSDRVPTSESVDKAAFYWFEPNFRVGLSTRLRRRGGKKKLPDLLTSALCAVRLASDAPAVRRLPSQHLTKKSRRGHWAGVGRSEIGASTSGGAGDWWGVEGLPTLLHMRSVGQAWTIGAPLGSSQQAAGVDKRLVTCGCGSHGQRPSCDNVC